RELSELLDFGEMSKAGAILDEPAGDPIGVARVEIQPSFDEEDAPPGLRERVPERGTAHSRPDDDGVPRRSLGMSIGDHGRHQTPSATINADARADLIRCGGPPVVRPNDSAGPSSQLRSPDAQREDLLDGDDAVPRLRLSQPVYRLQRVDAWRVLPAGMGGVGTACESGSASRSGTFRLCAARSGGASHVGHRSY